MCGGSAQFHVPKNKKQTGCPALRLCSPSGCGKQQSKIICSPSCPRSCRFYRSRQGKSLSEPAGWRMQRTNRRCAKSTHRTAPRSTFLQSGKESYVRHIGTTYRPGTDRQHCPKNMQSALMGAIQALLKQLHICMYILPPRHPPNTTQFKRSVRMQQPIAPVGRMLFRICRTENLCQTS